MTVVPARAASWSRRRIRSARDDRFPVQAGSLRASVGRGPGRLLVRARTGAPAFLPLPVPEIPAPAPQGLLLCVRQRNGEPTAEPVRLRESGFEFRRGQRGSACAEILDQCAEGAKQRVGRCPRLLIAHPLLELPHQTGDRLTVPGREPQGVEGPIPLRTRFASARSPASRAARNSSAIRSNSSRASEGVVTDCSSRLRMTVRQWPRRSFTGSVRKWPPTSAARRSACAQSAHPPEFGQHVTFDWSGPVRVVFQSVTRGATSSRSPPVQ